jgi:hypothetical protein
MRNGKVGESANIEGLTAQIEQMTLEEISALTSKMTTEVITGKVTSREARAIDHAVGKRLMAIERDLRQRKER